MGHMSSKRIRYLRASDGVRLAWAEAGAGPTVVKAANWLTHLESKHHISNRTKRHISIVGAGRPAHH
jgi:hypothetical protein